MKNTILKLMAILGIAIMISGSSFAKVAVVNKTEDPVRVMIFYEMPGTPFQISWELQPNEFQILEGEEVRKVRNNKYRYVVWAYKGARGWVPVFDTRTAEHYKPLLWGGRNAISWGDRIVSVVMENINNRPTFSISDEEAHDWEKNIETLYNKGYDQLKTLGVNNNMFWAKDEEPKVGSHIDNWNYETMFRYGDKDAQRPEDRYERRHK